MTEPLMFPSFRSKRLKRKSVEAGTGELVDMEAHRLWPMPPDKAERDRRAPPAPPSCAAAHAALVTAEMRGTEEKPGKWPVLGQFLMDLIRQRLESRRLNDFQAKRLADAVHAQLEHLDLKDVSDKQVSAVINGAEDLRDEVSESVGRLCCYAKAFGTPCAIHLQLVGLKLEEFQRHELWERNYTPVLQDVFLCVEPQLKAPEEVGQKTGRK